MPLMRNAMVIEDSKNMAPRYSKSLRTSPLINFERLEDGCARYVPFLIKTGCVWP